MGTRIQNHERPANIRGLGPGNRVATDEKGGNARLWCNTWTLTLNGLWGSFTTLGPHCDTVPHCAGGTWGSCRLTGGLRGVNLHLRLCNNSRTDALLL